MSANKAQTIATLVAARAAIDALLLELTDPAPETSDVASVDAETCQHEHRKEIKSFGAVEHWICADCGYEYRR